MKLKKILAVVLCFAMALSTMSFTVFAENEESISMSTYVANVDGTDYETLEVALKAITSGSTVTLLSDILVEGDDLGNWDERYTGGRISVPVTINGNNKTIKINATVNDNNYDAFFRLEADATIKNLTMDFSESTDTRIRAISQKAGNLTVENCTFIGRGSQDNSRAIIFGEGGGKDGVAATTVSISDVKFTGWRRGVTDNENAQDAKSVSITGCEFTDASAYVSAYENVVFSGNTMDDGWVNVKSYGNSETLTIVAENNTLEENSGANMNNIDGSTKAKIGNKYFASFKSAASAAVDGDVIELSSGEYSVQGINFGTVTVKAAEGADVVIDVPNKGNALPHTDSDANVTFEGVTLDFLPNGIYNGLQYNTVTCNNCTINGQMFLYSYTSDTFNNCTFVQDSANSYNVWTYSAKVATFNDCEFESVGKSVLVYDEGTTATTINVVDCEFVASAPADGKAAIEISTYGGPAYVTIDDKTTAEGFDAGSVSGNSLWNNKDAIANPTRVSDSIVKVADEVVYAKTNKPEEKVVAIVDNALYTSFADAVKNVKNDSTMIILEGEYDAALEITESNVTVIASGEVTLTQTPKFKGSNYYVEGINFAYNDSYNNLGGTGKFVDCDFTANVSTFRYCYAGTGTIEFNGCNLNAGAWAIHFDQAGGLDLVFTDCNITGRVALGSDLGSLTATGTSFNDSYINIWGTVTGATFDDCEFNNVPYIFTGYDLDNTVAFNDCTTNDEDGLAGLIYGGVDDANAEIRIDGEILTRVAKIGDNYYKTIEAAIAAAIAGDTIDLMGNVIDLPEVNSLKITNDLTIENGTIDITNGTWNGNSIIEVYGGTAGDPVIATFNNVDFVGDNYSSAFGVIYAHSHGKVVINGCDFNLSNEKYSAGGVLKGNGVAVSAFDVTNSTFDLENPNRIIANATVALNDIKIDAAVTDDSLVVGTMNNHAFRNLVGTINNSKISVEGFETGIKNTEGDLVISGNSEIILTGSKDTDLVVGAGKKVSVDDTSKLYADTKDIADDAILSGEGIIVKADSIYVQFKQIDFDAQGKDIEGYDKYEIVLVGANEEKINELASADLTFDFNGTPVTGGAMSYTVAPAEGVSLTQLGDRFMFNYDGVNKYEESGAAIVIGTITIDGYGSYKLATEDLSGEEKDTNAVYSTEIRDNIVDGFEDAATLIINTDMTADDGMVGKIDGKEIAVPVRDLTIKVDFPNAVENQVKAYQAMKVVISGGDLRENITVDLGSNAVETAVVISGKKDAKYASSMVDGSYVINVTDALTLNNAYTVTVSGAGYRTARYTVTMTEDKTLRFWNNVMDEAQFVEIGKESSKVNVTFLAGDIVKDNKINIYDLSAVVSYFGSVSTTENGYAKYDLNRDGVIDSKDVAYVLVSWDK